MRKAGNVPYRHSFGVAKPSFGVIKPSFGVMKVVGSALITSGLVLGALSGGAGASKASDKAQAKKALLVLSDLPKGWTSTKTAASTGGAFPGASQLASCIGVPSSIITANRPTADSPEFTNQAKSEAVDDSVTVFSSAKEAQAQYTALSSIKTPACMATLMNGTQKTQLQKAAGTGDTVGTITVAKIVPKNFAPHVTGFTVIIPISSQGQTVTVRTTEAFMVKGKVGHELRLTSYQSTFPASASKHLTKVAEGRL
jgi:hypothetical protein